MLLPVFQIFLAILYAYYNGYSNSYSCERRVFEIFSAYLLDCCVGEVADTTRGYHILAE
jgi:hypothetical protein